MGFVDPEMKTHNSRVSVLSSRKGLFFCNYQTRGTQAISYGCILTKGVRLVLSVTTFPLSVIASGGLP